MNKTQTQFLPEINFEHHVIAAKYCNQAAMEHSHAAECCANGSTDKADRHARNASDFCTKAQDHGNQTMLLKSVI
jgi:hypothetical protein